MSHHLRAARRSHARVFRWALGGVGVALLVVSGCDSTPATTPPPMFHARVGDCFRNPHDVLVPCTHRHRAQTVYVGGRPPAPAALAVRPCRPAEAAFLGADVNTRLDLRVWVSAAQRWYRCDLLLRRSTHGGDGYEDVTGSLRRTLSSGVPAHLQACLATRYRPRRDQRYVSCERPHVSQELTVAPAIGVLDEPLPADVSDRARTACHASASASGLLVGRRTVRALYPDTAKAWSSGLRAATCWVDAAPGSSRLPGIH
jgi:hypothetical protein